MKINFIKVLTDYQIIVCLIAAAATWKWGDWRNWKLYYPTILFFIAGNLLYNLVTYNYPLWEFESPVFKSSISDILIAFILFPATILLFLPNLPQKNFFMHALFFLLWILIYTTFELISYLLGYFSYHHGWNLRWSVLVNCVMFPILWLHHKKPLLAILLYFICAVSLIIIFKIPVSSMK